MTITIVTTVYNGVTTIADAMASVVRQRLDRVSLEYIVVDGGSNDGTVEKIREFEKNHSPASTPGFRFRWISEPDRGMYDALNKGIRMATGDVIGIVNSDDVLDGPEVLAKVAEKFGDSGVQDINCLFGNVRFVDATKPLNFENLKIARTKRICFAHWWRPWMLQWGYMPPHPAIFIRRRCFESWGAYIGDKKTYRIAADYELLIRFFRVYKMTHSYMRLCTTVMRSGGMSTANVEARRCLNAEIIKGNRENGYFCCWPMLLPKYAIKIWEVVLPRLGLIK